MHWLYHNYDIFNNKILEKNGEEDKILPHCYSLGYKFHIVSSKDIK